MPIYEYQCPKCGYEEEILFLNREDDKTEIPICEDCKIEMERKISKTSVKFGQSWGVTGQW